MSPNLFDSNKKSSFVLVNGTTDKTNKNYSLFLRKIKANMFPWRHPYILSPRLSGSYTVEAAVLVPIFLIFSMLILFVLKSVYTQWKVGIVLDELSQTAAVYNNSLFTKESIYGLFLADLKKDDVPMDFVEGGYLGFDFSESYVDEYRVCLDVTYRLQYPLTFLGNQGFIIHQRRCARIWNGFDPNQNKDGEAYVYVAKYGTVYHLSRYCSYIDPTIRSVTKEDLPKARNSSGSKYKKCDCCKGKQDCYYITSWGECYHSDISCSALKRTIYRMKLQEAEESYSRCSKCG